MKVRILFVVQWCHGLQDIDHAQHLQLVESSAKNSGVDYQVVTSWTDNKELQEQINSADIVVFSGRQFCEKPTHFKTMVEQSQNVWFVAFSVDRQILEACRNLSTRFGVYKHDARVASDQFSWILKKYSETDDKKLFSGFGESVYFPELNKRKIAYVNPPKKGFFNRLFGN